MPVNAEPTSLSAFHSKYSNCTRSFIRSVVIIYIVCVCVCAICAQAVNRKPFVTFIWFACGFEHHDDQRIFNLIFHWPLWVSFVTGKSDFREKRIELKIFCIFFLCMSVSNGCRFLLDLFCSSLHSSIHWKLSPKSNSPGCETATQSGSHLTINTKAEIVATFKFYSFAIDAFVKHTTQCIINSTK